MMKRLLACAAIFAAAGCAGPPDAPASQFAQSRGPECFRVNEVYGYSSGPDGLVDLQTAQGPFRVKLGPGCPDFSFFMEIGLRPMESSWLCERKWDMLITGDPIATNTCTISHIQSLASGALAAADLGRPAG
jgi:hypothetical protein